MRTSVQRLQQIVAATLLGVTFACASDGGPTGADYTIEVSASPTALTVEQGSSGTVTLTLVRGGGFDGAVTAAVSGLPTGVTASVSPATLTGSTSSAVVTVTVASTVTPGTYTATVTASASGVGSVTATYQLTVTEAPDYSLSATPNALTIQGGTSGTSTIDIARTNFTGAVTLALGSPPAGIVGAFDPPSPSGASSELTLTVAASVAAGDYTLTVNGTASVPGGGAQRHDRTHRDGGCPLRAQRRSRSDHHRQRTV